MNANHYFQNTLHFPKIDLKKINNHVFDEEFGFYSEEYFHTMLATERKRTERSQKQILLVMLGIGNLFNLFPVKNIVEDISSVLLASARDIDIKGWYKSRQKIGIIYTETTKSGKDPILKKIHSNLQLVFGREIAEKIEVAEASFPEEDGESVSGTAHIADTRFYPSPYNYPSKQRVPLLTKRGLDIIGSILLIILFSPLFIIIAILIKCTSRGPVFFTQTRIGLGGKQFKFIKFRSMRVGNDCSIHRDYIKKLIQGEPNGGDTRNNGVFKILNDPRITTIGKFIRKTSLDEIPQFFNVLIGDMSLVGPRPPIPYEIENYHAWHKRRVLEVRPGITGFWQVAGRSTTAFDTMVRMDLQYIMRWSLWWDIKLILRTPLAVFKGAY